MWKIQFSTFEIGLFASSPLDCPLSSSRIIFESQNIKVSDPMISVTLMVSHFHISNRKKACGENNFKISSFRRDTSWDTRKRQKLDPLLAGWGEWNWKSHLSTSALPASSFIISFRPCHVHYVSLEERILNTRFHSLPLHFSLPAAFVSGRSGGKFNFDSIYLESDSSCQFQDVRSVSDYNNSQK